MVSMTVPVATDDHPGLTWAALTEVDVDLLPCPVFLEPRACHIALEWNLPCCVCSVAFLQFLGQWVRSIRLLFSIACH